MPRTTRSLIAVAAAAATTLGVGAAGVPTADAMPNPDLGALQATHARTGGGTATASKSGALTPAMTRTSTAGTRFALRGWGYGTGVSGGDIPAASGATALETIGCTNRAGLVRTNQVADAAIPSLGTIEGVKTRVWTTKSRGVVSSWATNTIGRVTLSDSPLGSLVLTALSTTARAYHDGHGFKTSADTDLAKLQFKPASGPAMTFPVPKPNRPVEIPGFARVTVAHSQQTRSSTGATSSANGLKIDLFASHSTVRVARAVGEIHSGVKSGIFVGEAHSLGGKAAGDIATIGRNPLLKMPCQGTNGAVRTRSLTGLDLGGQVVVGAAHTQEAGKQTARRAWGYERGQVASIELGGGALKINGIVGQVNVTRSGKGLAKIATSTKGTTIGSIVANGQAQELPLTQTLEIPGVAKLQPRVVTKLPGGLRVTALRITLLDGSGAVIDLGNASLRIKRPSR